MKTQINFARAAVLLAVIAALAGCNTIAGIGKDVSAGGKAVEKAAEKTKEKM
ncbi:entericidin A/B family lipoprotein [Derxia lacustris]|uniref:entericidin A/B family lipoprotein n=1 Tax=Derxia lacustris TaxID=764842 RepID=UPI000A1778E1|nr:entericidin A/B family lipoprotein [Derxia lacustris]